MSEPKSFYRCNLIKANVSLSKAGNPVLNLAFASQGVDKPIWKKLTLLPDFDEQNREVLTRCGCTNLPAEITANAIINGALVGLGSKTVNLKEWEGSNGFKTMYVNEPSDLKVFDNRDDQSF